MVYVDYKIVGSAVTPHVLRLKINPHSLLRIESTISKRFKGYNVSFDHYGRSAKVEIL